MKILLHITLLILAISLNAQNENNIIKSGIGVGFGEDGLRTNTFELEYQRHVLKGINIITGYFSSSGGISVNNLFNETDSEVVLNASGNSIFTSLDGTPLGHHYTMKGIKLGLQKNVKLTRKINIGISISGVQLNISETAITNIIYNPSGLDGEKLLTKFATYSKIGAEVGLHVKQNIASYVNIGSSIKYITERKFIIPNVYAEVTF